MENIRQLIVNADDFGLSRGINDGVIAAHQHGLVTSASLMVRGKAVQHAVEASQSHPNLGLGLHLDLGEWFYRDHAWIPLYNVVVLDDPAAVDCEVERQLDAFCDLVGKPPTHLDSHQHIHREPFVAASMHRIANRLGVPLRHFSDQVRYCGAFYGQTQLGNPEPDWISQAALLGVLSQLEPGITELGCHPALAVDFPGQYLAERLAEVHTLCAPSMLAAVAEYHITLRSFAGISSAVSSARSVA